MRLSFTKMEGAGNDFVVVDATTRRVGLSPPQIRTVCDRHKGVGADQVLVIARGDESADLTYRIFNTDGKEVEHCGNGARCAALYAFDRLNWSAGVLRMRTLNRVLEAHRSEHGSVEVAMGAPSFAVGDVPFSSAASASRATEGAADYWTIEGLSVPFAVASMGNPHAVVWVDEVRSTPISEWGRTLQSSAAFPESVNVSFVQIESPTSIRMRTYERAAGETQACGSGACAALAIGARSGRLASTVQVQAAGGLLICRLDDEGGIWLDGPASFVFEGSIDV